ncbi:MULTISPECIES: hypothetical protein [unclassified Streptomyces]|uniref:hypothetical protein n=1 Tax=unclassified Streptomyces TaxID=2593676 RepID=UPI000AA95670|nr:hypothetical protein [Streptomyces sp. NRRL S-87]
MRWMSKGAVRGMLLALVVAGGIPALAAHTAGRAPHGPGCRSVAYMSVVGLGPDCR